MSTESGDGNGGHEDVGNGLVKAFGKVLGDLAARVTDPWVAAGLIVFIGFAVVIAFSYAGSTIGIILLAIIAIATFLFFAWMHRERLRVTPPVTSNGGDTLTLAESLDEQARTHIQTALARAATESAQLLGVDHLSVRSNLFGIGSDRTLTIIDGFTYHMDRPEELTLTLEVGQGSTGRAYVTARPNIAILRSDWGEAAIPDEKLRKIHPDLRWIVSIPVFAGGPEPRPVWILNVDGLRETPVLTALQEVVGGMVFYAQLVSLLLSNALSGGETSHEA